MFALLRQTDEFDVDDEAYAVEWVVATVDLQNTSPFPGRWNHDDAATTTATDSTYIATSAVVVSRFYGA